MDESANGMNKALIGIIVVIVLVAVSTAVVVVAGNVQEDSASGPASETISNSQSTGAPASSGTNQPNGSYKDGSYTANGGYITPGGSESIDVTLTLSDGVVTAASIEQNAITNEAKQFQSQFESGFESEVVGKNIDEVNLSRVAGSSLTPVGFNDAIQDIKADARA